MVNGKYQKAEFKSDKDVWRVIKLIIKETEEVNNKIGKDFDIAESVILQLPFFACKNILFDKDISKDIQRYLYCEKFNVSPYKGDYGKQPCLWIEKSSLIRKYLAKLESQQINKAKLDGTRKN